MLIPEVNWDLCQECDDCQAKQVCNVRAIVQIDPGEAIYIDYGRCNRCGSCVDACCCKAITMVNDNSVRMNL